MWTGHSPYTPRPLADRPRGPAHTIYCLRATSELPFTPDGAALSKLGSLSGFLAAITPDFRECSRGRREMTWTGLYIAGAPFYRQREYWGIPT